MSHISGRGQHRSWSSNTGHIALIAVLVAVLGVALGLGAWFVAMHNDANDVSRPGTSTVADTSLDKSGSVPQPVTEHHGNSPDCPDTDCIAMLVNGDLLFHEGLWSHFQGPNPNATDGTAFNFDPLFAPMKQYIQASDIAVCEFETPIAQRGGPYAAYPIFNIPPEVADAARNVGYNACTHATNHSWDQGADGIARLWDTLEADGIERVHLIDASPIGANVRSTVATYSGVLDDLRRAFAKTDAARERGLKAGDFSYNTGSLRCPSCDGTGQVSLDVQFLPDVDVPCPACGGSRYAREAFEIERAVSSECLAGRPEGEGLRAVSLPELLAMTVDEARACVDGLRTAKAKLDVLSDLGLGYLTLGEATPALSGGEAQRLKLAGEMTRNQENALFVFDEPTIGLHPLDVEVLIGVLQRLVGKGAAVVAIEHDLDMIANADYVIDMGPGGGDAGGCIVACGTPEQVAACEASITGRYLREELEEGPSL